MDLERSIFFVTEEGIAAIQAQLRLGSFFMGEAAEKHKTFEVVEEKGEKGLK